MPELAVVRLRAADLVPAAEVLRVALFDEPLLSWLLPDRGRRARLLPRLCRHEVARGLRLGAVYATAPDIRGVAVWLRPEAARPTIAGLARAGAAVRPLELGVAGIGRALRLLGSRRAFGSGAPEAGWHLWLLGVAPEYQGRGIGGTLLRPMLARADAEGTACTLRTFAAVNVRFYEQYGYGIAAAGTVPAGGPPVWAMRRPPRDRSASADLMRDDADAESAARDPARRSWPQTLRKGNAS